MGFVEHGFTATWDKILGLPHHHTYIQSTHELFCVCVCFFERERERVWDEYMLLLETSAKVILRNIMGR
jgi:hypothetical protein